VTRSDVGGIEMTVQTRPDAARRWLGEARAVLDRLEATQLDPIEQAADLFARTIAADGLVHVFGFVH